MKRYIVEEKVLLVFFLVCTTGLSTGVKVLCIYFYVHMLWIAPGKGRPDSQKEELMLFEFSLGT